MLGSAEDKEEAFSFLCESFETERKKNKKDRGGEGAKSLGCCIDSALCNRSFLSLSSPSRPIDYSSFIFSLFVSFSPSYTPELKGSVGLRGVHELCERTRETQKVNEAGRCGEQSCRFFYLSLSRMGPCISERKP